MKTNTFTGINNVMPDTRLASTELVQAENIDLDDAGRLLRADSLTEVVSGAYHSLRSLDRFSLVRHGDTLSRFDGTVTPLKTGLIPGAPMSYSQYPGLVYMGDGKQMLGTDGEQVWKWGVTRPVSQQVVTAIAGTMPQGRYLVAITYLRDDGEESGTPDPVAILGTGIMVSHTEPFPDDVTRWRVYVSLTDGQELFACADMPVSVDVAEVVTISRGAALKSPNVEPPPVSGLVAAGNGRTFCAVENFLFYSSAFRPEQFDRYRQTIPFKSDVTLIAPVQAGVFVGTSDGGYMLNGQNIEQASMSIPLNIPILKGEPIPARVQFDSAVSDGFLFWCAKGLAFLSQDGLVTLLTEQRYRAAGSSFAVGAHHPIVGNNRAILIT